MLPALDATTSGGEVAGVCAPACVAIASQAIRSVGERRKVNRMGTPPVTAVVLSFCRCERGPFFLLGLERVESRGAELRACFGNAPGCFDAFKG
jgi:hypothetical protein